MPHTLHNPVLPVMYKVRDKVIPENLTLEQRQIFVSGLGVPTDKAAVFAMQDRSASLIARLLRLIEKTDNDAAKEAAYIHVELRNKECDAFFYRK